MKQARRVCVRKKLEMRKFGVSGVGGEIRDAPAGDLEEVEVERTEREGATVVAHRKGLLSHAIHRGVNTSECSCMFVLGYSCKR